MLEIEKEIFKKSIADFNRLKQYGFILIDNHYIFNKTFFHNEFKATIIVDKNSIVTSKVVDLDTGEEYSNIKNSAFTDGFVLKVREAYEILLNDIKTKCFVNRYFCSKQGMMILDYIDETYHIYPEFLWPKHPSYGVFKVGYAYQYQNGAQISKNNGIPFEYTQNNNMIYFPRI